MNKFKICCLLSFIFLHFSFGKVWGQTDFSCGSHDKIFIRVEYPPEFNGSLQTYFENELKDVPGEYNGTVQLSIIIDSIGSPCLASIQNNRSFISSSKLKETVDKMTG